jgi:hypothetical protein
LVELLQRELRAARQSLDEARRELADARRRIAELEQQVAAAEQQVAAAERKAAAAEQRAGAERAKFAEPFSLRAEEKRQESRGKKKRQRKRPLRCGRVTTAEKLKLAQRTEKVFPAGVAEADCQLSHTRPVWRLEEGRAVLIAYEIYRGPKNQYGKISGVLGRSEFGLEIVIAIGFQVHVVGLSFDKVCLLMNFFQNLPLRKSQVDALLNQLARHWSDEFERLCTLLANSAVVHADETSWSLNSVWAFLSEKVRVLFFGVHKDAATLQQILDPATFAGIVVSDDAAVYANFTHAQKCWAHLLRKAIKLTLLEPDNAEYRSFADRLLEIYRSACRAQRDGRLSDAGRAQKVAELEDELLKLCGPISLIEQPINSSEQPIPRGEQSLQCGEQSLNSSEQPRSSGAADDFRRLSNELLRLLLAQELFTFATAAAVTTPAGETQAVSGTNNEAERTLRSSATARKTGRTNKTRSGARRQTIIVSVLESLRCFLPRFTLTTVIAEIQRWTDTGQSCFARQMKKLQLNLPTEPLLNRLLPLPSG